MEIDPFSLPVLFVEVIGQETDETVGTATAFLLQAGARLLLVTNWHVVTGAQSAEPSNRSIFEGATPKSLVVHFRKNARETVPLPVALLDQAGPARWIEPEDRSVIQQTSRSPKVAPDCVIIDVTDTARSCAAGAVQLDPYTFVRFRLWPMDEIAVIGYPFGRFGSGPYPIWITGTVANDLAGVPDQKFFLVDARTRQGGSGSLVVSRIPGASLQRPGGTLTQGGLRTTHVVGIYSGRLEGKRDSDIGIVWHWEVIERMLRKIVPAGDQTWRVEHERGKP